MAASGLGEAWANSRWVHSLRKRGETYQKERGRLGVGMHHTVAGEERKGHDATYMPVTLLLTYNTPPSKEP